MWYLLVLTVSQAYILTSVSESESTASGASTDDKTATVQYKHVTILAGNNDALTHYEQSRGYNQILRVIQYSCLVGSATVIS